MLSCSMVHADNGDDFVRIDVLLKQVINKTLTRTVCPIPMDCCFDSLCNSIITTFDGDIGNVRIRIANIENGTTNTTFVDSSQRQTLTFVTGDSGSYIITYETLNGNIYEGYFDIP